MGGKKKERRKKKKKAAPGKGGGGGRGLPGLSVNLTQQLRGDIYLHKKKEWEKKGITGRRAVQCLTEET